MLTLRNTALSLIFGMLTLINTGCKPEYPNCESDEHCAEKGQVCAGQICRSCRDDQHCTVPGQICSSNECVYRSGYCDDKVSCPGNQKCRNNECGAECLGKDECSANEFCDEGNCTTKPECGPNADKADCSEGYKCTTSGRCEQIRISCGFDAPIYFDFGSANIKRSQRSKFKNFVECMAQRGANNATIAGHADEVGDTSYNLALGEERAEAVRKVLTRLGVEASMLGTRSYGEEQPAVNSPGRQPKNRRVESE